MSSRPGIYVIVRHPADGGESPNRYLPEITAEFRIHWPPKATKGQVHEALAEAWVKAVAKVQGLEMP